MMKDDFSGGLVGNKHPTRLAPNEYALMINGRTRNGTVDPIKLPEAITTLAGKKQGIYAAGSIMVVFVNGEAYYRDFAGTDASFKKVAGGFLLDSNVDFIYAELVPASTLNFKRLPQELRTVAVANGPVSLTLPVSSSPGAVLAQDGINQPWVILSDGTSRVTQNYSEWDAEELNGALREYVPIGKFMRYSNGILYMVGKDEDGKFTRFIRSVSGRPLDFMVNIDRDGNKQATEDLGGAHTVGINVDYAELTALARTNAPDGSIFVSTSQNSYLVSPDFQNSLFGEPTFRATGLFSTGALNNFSFIDISGDMALIDFSGLRSFNAVMQLQNEGRNSPFSMQVHKYLGELVQNVACATTFDNYALFAVDTIYGSGIIVYDTMTKVFVSLDLYPNVTGKIKQFCEIKTTTNRRLFFITTNDELFEAFASTTTAKCQIYLGEWLPPSIEGVQYKEQKPQTLELVFLEPLEDGTVYASLFADSYKVATLSAVVKQLVKEPTIPRALPFGDVNEAAVRPITFKFDGAPLCKKVGFFVEFDFKCQLLGAEYTADPYTIEQNSWTEAARAFKQNT